MASCSHPHPPALPLQRPMLPVFDDKCLTTTLLTALECTLDTHCMTSCTHPHPPALALQRPSDQLGAIGGPCERGHHVMLRAEQIKRNTRRGSGVCLLLQPAWSHWRAMRSRSHVMDLRTDRGIRVRVRVGGVWVCPASSSNHQRRSTDP